MSNVEKNPYTRKAYASFIITVSFGILFLGLIVDTYNSVPYEIDVIESHLKSALQTHNVNDKVRYIEETVLMLGPYYGNPAWPYPDQDSNIDLTKEILLSVARDVKQQTDVKDREGYFILPHNELVKYLNGEISDTGYRLSAYSTGWWSNPANSLAQVWIFVPIIIIGLIVSFSYGASSSDWRPKGY